jgi:hypothetical protein
MSGCDYLDNVKGIGFLKILNNYESGPIKGALREMLVRGLSAGTLTTYLRNVELACLCFTHQLAYNGHAKREADRQVPVNRSPT